MGTWTKDNSQGRSGRRTGKGTWSTYSAGWVLAGKKSCGCLGRQVFSHYYWVGRSQHIICKFVWVPGWRRGDRMASGGFALKEVPGLSDRFSTFYSSDCLASSFFLGRPQRGIYWGKCGFSLPGAFLSKQPWYGTIGLKLNSWIKCTHTYEFKDLSTSLVGKFTDGQMVSGREAKLQGLTCRLVVFHELRVQNNQTSLKGVYSIAQAI